MSLKNFVVQYVHIPSGAMQYSNVDAETPSQAIDQVFGSSYDESYRVHSVYMNIDDVHEHYNVRRYHV